MKGNMSNYRHHSDVVNDVLDSEEVNDEVLEELATKCNACFGTGLDRYVDADCMTCWGEGTILVSEP